MTEEKKRWLSKSQINCFLQCPMKWKYIYLDEIQNIPSEAQSRGTRIHEKIEKFYKEAKIENKKVYLEKPDDDLKKFIEFENERMKDCPSLQYFMPIFQELKLANPELMLRGVIDAVFINPKDNKAIIIDWKTGSYNSSSIDDYRLELAIYKILFESDSKLNIPVGYWAIFFTDKGKLFFEEVDDKYVQKALKIIEKVRLDISKGEYKMHPGFKCRWCQFKDTCGGNNVNI